MKDYTSIWSLSWSVVSMLHLKYFLEIPDKKDLYYPLSSCKFLGKSLHPFLCLEVLLFCTETWMPFFQRGLPFQTSRKRNWVLLFFFLWLSESNVPKKSQISSCMGLPLTYLIPLSGFEFSLHKEYIKESAQNIPRKLQKSWGLQACPYHALGLPTLQALC